MALLIVLVVAGLLRLSMLDSKSLWFDEAFSVSLSNYTPQRIWQPNVARLETHPPLYYHGLHYWTNWFGDSETMVRLPSALISLINVALIYLLGCRLFDRRTALLAAALLAVSPLNLWYAQEARMYVFMTTILLLSAVLLTWDNWWAIPPLAATFAVGLYLDYTMVPIWALLSAIWTVFWWQYERSLRRLLIWLISSITAWLFFLPWLANFYGALATFSTVHLFIRLNESLGLPVLTPGGYLVVMSIGALLLVPIFAALVKLQQRKQTQQWVFAAVLIGFTLATLLFPFPRLYSIKRILVQIWPLMILWAAWILNQIDGKRRILTPGLLVLSLAACLAVLLLVPKDDWRGAIDFINKNALEGDRAAVDPSYNAVLITYYDLNIPLERVQDNNVGAGSSGALWFFAERFPGQETPSSPTEQLLNEKMELVETVPFYRLELRRYRAKAR